MRSINKLTVINGDSSFSIDEKKGLEFLFTNETGKMIGHVLSVDAIKDAIESTFCLRAEDIIPKNILEMHDEEAEQHHHDLLARHESIKEA